MLGNIWSVTSFNILIKQWFKDWISHKMQIPGCQRWGGEGDVEYQRFPYVRGWLWIMGHTGSCRRRVMPDRTAVWSAWDHAEVDQCLSLGSLWVTCRILFCFLDFFFPSFFFVSHYVLEPLLSLLHLKLSGWGQRFYIWCGYSLYSLKITLERFIKG